MIINALDAQSGRVRSSRGSAAQTSNQVLTQKNSRIWAQFEIISAAARTATADPAKDYV